MGDADIQHAENMEATQLTGISTGTTNVWSQTVQRHFCFALGCRAIIQVYQGGHMNWKHVSLAGWPGCLPVFLGSLRCTDSPAAERRPAYRVSLPPSRVGCIHRNTWHHVRKLAYGWIQVIQHPPSQSLCPVTKYFTAKHNSPQETHNAVRCNFF